MEFRPWPKLHDFQLVSVSLLFQSVYWFRTSDNDSCSLSANLTISPGSTISTNQDFTVSVTVTNNGKLDGKEVVQVLTTLIVRRHECKRWLIDAQVYSTDIVSSVATPNQELVGFKKISLK